MPIHMQQAGAAARQEVAADTAVDLNTSATQSPERRSELSIPRPATDLARVHELLSGGLDSVLHGPDLRAVMHSAGLNLGGDMANVLAEVAGHIGRPTSTPQFESLKTVPTFLAQAA